MSKARVLRNWASLTLLAAMLIVASCALVMRFFNREFRYMLKAPPSRELVRNLRSTDRDIVMASLNYLTEAHDPSGRDVAKDLLSNPDEHIVLNAAMYLGSLGDEDSIPYLIDSLNGPAILAREEIGQLLRKMTGRDFGTDYKSWSKWWRASNEPEAGPAGNAQSRPASSSGE